MGFDLGKTLGVNSDNEGWGGKALSIMAPGLQETAGALGLGKKVGMPVLEKAELNADARAILAQRSADAAKDPAQYEQEIVDEQNQGTDQAGLLLSGGEMDSPYGKALHDRQSKELQSYTGRQKQSDKNDAPAIRAGS